MCERNREREGKYQIGRERVCEKEREKDGEKRYVREIEREGGRKTKREGEGEAMSDKKRGVHICVRERDR